MADRWRQRLLFAVILAMAVWLRFWGLRWGLPNALHSYSYHPDEFLTVGAAGAVATGFFPGFYNYPSLYIYFAATAITAGSVYGFVHGLAGIYLCARVVTALMGIIAVAVTYWSGKQMNARPGHANNVRPGHANNVRPGYAIPDGNSPGHVAPNAQAIGLLAALILCVAPLHVQHSHFATVDVPSTVFVAACLGFAMLVLSRGSWRDYLLCGAMAGLGAGTKYNAGLVILALVAAHFLHKPRQHREPTREHPELVEGRSRAAKLLAGVGCAIGAFIISTPAVVFKFSAFWHGFSYELHHAQTGHGLVFVGTGNGFLFTFTSSLWYGLGPALAILFVISAIYGIIRLDRRALVILAFTIPYYALISFSQVRFARYSLPLFPPAALLIAWMACDLYQRLSEAPVREGGLRSMLPRIYSKALAVVLILSFAGTLLYTIALDRLFVQPAPQDRAARWIFANIPKGSSIGMVEVPWFYSPPYSRSAGLGTLSQRIAEMARAPYRLELFSADRNRVKSLNPDWFVLSDYEIGDASRLKNVPGLPPEGAIEAARINADVQWVFAHYDQRKRFGYNISDLLWLGEARDLPHDMRYPAPTIWIYHLKRSSASQSSPRLRDSHAQTGGPPK